MPSRSFHEKRSISAASGDASTSVCSVFAGVLHMVDDEDIDLGPDRLELQSELFLECREK
jgi:hypothetical protein